VARLIVKKTFKLRPFKPIDLEKVININKRCLPENYSNSFFLNMYEHFPETFIVAEESEEIAGYIMCRIERRISDFRLMGIVKKGHVISIAVLPEYRRQSIGYLLMLEAIKAMKKYNAEECVLEVRRSNISAVNLYRKMGFKVIRTLYGYYADREDAYRMARKL
jgi:ribosomal-protein-alanine N-acetyltransferase